MPPLRIRSKVCAIAISSLEAGAEGAYVTAHAKINGSAHVPSVHLADRGVVRVSGEDAKTFLDGLITCDVDRIAPAGARFGALLTPQGKILFDFIVFQAPEEIGGGYYLDVLKVFAPDLAKRLGFYKLRAKVMVEDLSDSLGLVAGWDAPPPEDEAGLVVEDPRL